MGIIKQSADLVYAFRFIRILTSDWKSLDAYKLGIIDENGKRVRDVKIDSPEKKNAYTSFIRMAINIKRLLRGNRLLGFAAGLFLIREKFQLSDWTINKILKECNLEVMDILSENSQWFLLEDKQLSPGIYRLKNAKAVNTTFEELANANDKIRVTKMKPVGEIFGLDIYEATHIRSGQQVYVTIGELLK